ncbi:Tctex1 domain-containing protein 2, partial [Stegodyphus mimosarum]
MKDIVSQISSTIREELKHIGLDRYRIVCQVTVGEKCDQDIIMTFLCLWKHEFDHYAIATYDNAYIFSTAIVFVIYKQ